MSRVDGDPWSRLFDCPQEALAHVLGTLSSSPQRLLLRSLAKSLVACHSTPLLAIDVELEGCEWDEREFDSDTEEDSDSEPDKPVEEGESGKGEKGESGSAGVREAHCDPGGVPLQQLMMEQMYVLQKELDSLSWRSDIHVLWRKWGRILCYRHLHLLR